MWSAPLLYERLTWPEVRRAASDGIKALRQTLKSREEDTDELAIRST